MQSCLLCLCFEAICVANNQLNYNMCAAVTECVPMFGFAVCIAAITNKRRIS